MPATTIVPGKWTLKLGLVTADTEFTCEAGGFHIASNPVTSTVPASFCKDAYDDIAAVTHSLTIDFQGFLEDADALWYFLWDNAGAEAFVEFAMTGTGKPVFAGTVRVVKPPLDAVSTQVVTGSVTMPFLTGPTVTKPTVLAAAASKTKAEKEAVPA